MSESDTNLEIERKTYKVRNLVAPATSIASRFCILYKCLNFYFTLASTMLAFNGPSCTSWHDFGCQLGRRICPEDL